MDENYEVRKERIEETWNYINKPEQETIILNAEDKNKCKEHINQEKRNEENLELVSSRYSMPFQQSEKDKK
jgi:hypothetical protein